MKKFAVYAAAALAWLSWSLPAPASSVALVPDETYVFRGIVDDESVADALGALAKISGATKAVTLVIDSPGGYVDSGLKLLTGMRILQSQGVTFRCLVTGMAASMAFSVLAECDTRYTLATSGLLWHPIRTGGPRSLTTQQAQEIADSLEYYEQPFRQRLIDSLRVDEDYFYLHWFRETMHPGRTLAQTLPYWIEEASGATGMPMKDLLWIPEPRGFFGEADDLAEPRRLIWVAPGYGPGEVSNAGR